ncbi:MAG: DEAD/DEAH box helicase [Anaerolineales bacterium]
MNFTQFNLDARLRAGITRAGYAEPTRIQLAAIPPALAGRDLIGTAQTGTGKTAAFVLPILHKLLTNPRKGTRAIIITPTRELAEQIHESIRILGSGSRIRSATIYGGVGAGPQIKALRSGVEILVACPGRLLDHLNHGRARFENVDMLVLDEADRMLDMGFLPDVRRILKHLPLKRQTMLFSATFPREIERLANQTLHRPQRVAVGLSRPAQTVSHALYPVNHHLKTRLLLALLKQTDAESVLIFARTKHRAKRLARQIEQAGHKVTSLHGNRTQGQRQSALRGFKTGLYQIMVATDIAARGLDVESITHVINYDMPDTADAYIHRIGRTGRAERSGDALTLVTPDDAAMVRTLERIMDEPLARRSLADFDYAALAPHGGMSGNGNARRGRKHRNPRPSERGRRGQPRRRTAPA